MKITLIKQEVEEIKEQVYFTEEEEEVLILWLKGKSVVETSILLNMSTATVTRRRKDVKDKIRKFYDYKKNKR